jgi:PAS domain S-box-containing protein
MASPSWAQLLGYDSLDDCIGYSIAEKFYFEPHRRKEFLEAVNRNGSVSDYEVVLKNRDGRPVYVSTNSHLYYGEAGDLLGVEGIFRDISERYATAKKMREQIEQMGFFSRKLQDFIELSPESDIFHAIGEGFHEILPDTVILVNSYKPVSNALKVRAIFGEHDREILEKYIGREVIGMIIPLPDEERTDNAMTGMVYPARKNQYELLIEHLAPGTFGRIENSLNIGDIYSVGLIWHGMLLGTIIFALKKGDTLADISLIETFARAASIAAFRARRFV